MKTFKQFTNRIKFVYEIDEASKALHNLPIDQPFREGAIDTGETPITEEVLTAAIISGEYDVILRERHGHDVDGSECGRAINIKGNVAPKIDYLKEVYVYLFEMRTAGVKTQAWFFQLD